jgi:hypothetical protein
MKSLSERLAERAWSVLNHDNDPRSGNPADAHNWKALKAAMRDELKKADDRAREKYRLVMEDNL